MYEPTVAALTAEVSAVVAEIDAVCTLSAEIACALHDAETAVAAVDALTPAQLSSRAAETHAILCRQQETLHRAYATLHAARERLARVTMRRSAVQQIVADLAAYTEQA